MRYGDPLRQVAEPLSSKSLSPATKILKIASAAKFEVQTRYIDGGAIACGTRDFENEGVVNTPPIMQIVLL